MTSPSFTWSSSPYTHTVPIPQEVAPSIINPSIQKPFYRTTSEPPPRLNSTPINLSPLTPNSNRLPPLQNQQRPIQTRLTKPLPLDKLPPQRRQARTPPNRQSSAQLLLQPGHFFIQFFAPLVVALVHGVHGAGEEEPDGFVDVCGCGDGGEGQLGEGLGDADYGFELSDGDGDGAAGVALEFGLVDLFADLDEVGRELF